MKPVDQDQFHDPGQRSRGNCLQAALASLLELRLDEVPNFHEFPPGSGFWEYFEVFLRQRGFVPIHLPETRAPDYACVYLAHGDSPRGIKHSVVFRDGRLVHDPHPSRAGLLKIDYVTLLVPVDPAIAARATTELR